jgi:crotonobetainyl-CoA:carnitine CoA-transferase CaiB-like acyl-CoA transferase
MSHDSAPCAIDLPLAGLVAIEIGHSVAAPFAGQILADLGARVIKVEQPETGDDARTWGPPFWHGASATFQSLNRNKVSVAVDLQDAQQLASLKALLATADIVFQNLRPGVVRRFGIDGETMCKAHSPLIYCNMGAFGTTGPLRDRPGYDPLMQAFGGLMSVTGEPDRPPVRVTPSIIDMGTGMWSVIGILAAIERRHKTGVGGVIDASLFETALSWMTVSIAIALASGREPRPTGSETAMIVPYKAYRAADRHMVIAAGNDSLFRRLAAALGHAEWTDDPCYRDNAARVTHRETLNASIDEIVATMPAAHWTEVLDAAGVPCAPLQTVNEVLVHPQTRAVEMVCPVPDSPLTLVGLPLRFDGRRPPMRTAPPALGSRNVDVFGGAAGEP